MQQDIILHLVLAYGQLTCMFVVAWKFHLKA